MIVMRTTMVMAGCFVQRNILFAPQVRKPAEAEKYRLEKIAEAERNRVVLEAEAEAEAQALRGEVFLFSIFDLILLFSPCF